MNTIRAGLDRHFEDLKSRHVDAVIDYYANRPDLYIHLGGPRWTTIIHEHFSQPMDNPYSIGDWLRQ